GSRLASDARRGSCRRRSGGRCGREIEAADFRGAGASASSSRITSCTGRTAGRRASIIRSCCARLTTPRCTRAASGSRRTIGIGGSSAGPTDGPCRRAAIGRRTSRTTAARRPRNISPEILPRRCLWRSALPRRRYPHSCPPRRDFLRRRIPRRCRRAYARPRQSVRRRSRRRLETCDRCRVAPSEGVAYYYACRRSRQSQERKEDRPMRSNLRVRCPAAIVLASAAALFVATAAYTQPETPTPFQQHVLDAMQGEIRTDEERTRDPNRMPAEVLEFFRMRDDMRVIEILPAGGWYTKILAPVLKERGTLYIAHPSGFYAGMFAPLAELPGLGEVEAIDWGASGTGGGVPFGPRGRWDVEPVDLVLIFCTYHNFSVEDRMTLNRTVFDALKPGGYYGIVDHTRRHMEPRNRENGRRVDPVLVIKEVQETGFELVDFSDVLAR